MLRYNIFVIDNPFRVCCVDAPSLYDAIIMGAEQLDRDVREIRSVEENVEYNVSQMSL